MCLQEVSGGLNPFFPFKPLPLLPPFFFFFKKKGFKPNPPLVKRGFKTILLWFKPLSNPFGEALPLKHTR